MVYCLTAVATVIIMHTVTTVFGISCYHCTILPPPPIKNAPPTRLCSKFNKTQLYEVDCPLSTFCMKKTFTLPLSNKKSVVIMLRGCAPQKQLNQVKKNGVMAWETSIAEDIYQAGCSWTDNSQQQKINTEEICYCQGHLCNGQSKKEAGSHIDIISVIFVYNAIKYVRSFQ